MPVPVRVVADPAVPEATTAASVALSDVVLGVKVIVPKLHEEPEATVAEAQAPGATEKSAAFVPATVTGVADRITAPPVAAIFAVPEQEEATPMPEVQETPVTETAAVP